MILCPPPSIDEEHTYVRHRKRPQVHCVICRHPTATGRSDFILFHQRLHRQIVIFERIGCVEGFVMDWDLILMSMSIEKLERDNANIRKSNVNDRKEQGGSMFKCTRSQGRQVGLKMYLCLCTSFLLFDTIQADTCASRWDILQDIRQ